MHVSKLQIELRTVKMAIVIFLCIGIYLLIGQGDRTSAMMVAAVTAIIGIHPDTADAWTFAIYRVIGTSIGCIAGICYFWIQDMMHDDSLCRLIFIPLFCLIVAVICGGFKHPITVLGAVIAIIVMTLVVSDGSGWSYVWERVLATAVGVIAAVIVNWIIHPRSVHLFHDLKRSVSSQKKKEDS